MGGTGSDTKEYHIKNTESVERYVGKVYGLQDYDAGLFRNPSELSWYVGALQWRCVDKQDSG